MPHDAALRFPGAADFAFARRFFEERGVTSPRPCQEVLAQYGEWIRAARTDRELLLYVPTNAPVTLRGDWSGYRAYAVDLESGGHAPLAMEADAGGTCLGMHPYYSDALIVLVKS